MDDSRSAKAVMQFLEYCKDKGLMKPRTAESRKAAVNQVLGILSEDEASDVAQVNLDVVMRRFQNLHGDRYTPDSLRTYKARVKNSIFDFLRFRENPMDFKPTPAVSAKPNTKPKPPSKPATRTDGTPRTTAIWSSSGSSFLSTSTLPIPIRQDLTVLIHGLPFDLSETEARKIANVVLALAGVSAGKA